MAKLDITLSKEAFDKLGEELKGFYVPTEDQKGYELEGIGSIQRALAKEKAAKTPTPELLSEVEQLRKFKTDQGAAAAKAAEKDLEAQGKYEEALAIKEKAWQERIDKEAADKAQLLTRLHNEAAKSELIKRGGIPERVDYLAAEIVSQTEFELGEAGAVLRKKGGIGDAAELEAMFGEAKNAKPFFFAADGASGSGASGSDGTGGGGKTMPHAQWKALSPKDQAAFISSGGKPVE